jgi:uncharacterized protein involved in cysteine biosynthesis
VKKRCIVCGTLIDINNNSLNDQDVSAEKCRRCLNSSAVASLKNAGPARSMFYIFDGFSYLFKKRKLFKLSIVPLLITTFILFLVYGAFLYLFIKGLNQYMPAYDPEGVSGTIISIGKYALGLFGSLLISIFTLFLFLPVSSIICIPFNDIISLEAENIFLGEQAQNTEQGKYIDEVKVGVKEMFKLLFFKLLVILIALPLLLIPVFGGILFIFIICLLTAIDFLDIVMARKKYSLSEKLQFIKMNKMAFTTFSVPFLLLFWVPIIQIFIIPSATIAGTKFFLEAKKKS